MAVATPLVGSGLTANIGFVGLDIFAFTAHWVKWRPRHGVADTVKQEQGRLVGKAGLPVNLKGANALLGRCRAPEPEAPMLKRDCAVLKHGTLTHGVLPFAIVAAPAEIRLPLAGLTVLHLIDVKHAAQRAKRLVAPTLLLDELHRRLLVLAGERKGGNYRIALGGLVLYFALCHGKTFYLSKCLLSSIMLSL